MTPWTVITGVVGGATVVVVVVVATVLGGAEIQRVGRLVASRTGAAFAGLPRFAGGLLDGKVVDGSMLVPPFRRSPPSGSRTIVPGNAPDATS